MELIIFAKNTYDLHNRATYINSPRTILTPNHTV